MRVPVKELKVGMRVWMQEQHERSHNATVSEVLSETRAKLTLESGRNGWNVWKKSDGTWGDDANDGLLLVEDGTPEVACDSIPKSERRHHNCKHYSEHCGDRKCVNFDKWEPRDEATKPRKSASDDALDALRYAATHRMADMKERIEANLWTSYLTPTHKELPAMNQATINKINGENTMTTIEAKGPTMSQSVNVNIEQIVKNALAAAKMTPGENCKVEGVEAGDFGVAIKIQTGDFQKVSQLPAEVLAVLAGKK